MQVLNNDQIKRKIHRMAYQVYEEFLESDELIIAGINGNGFELAKILCSELREISPIFIHLAEIHLDKVNPTAATTKISGNIESYTNKPVVIIDDVLNTGRTMVYAISAFIREESSLIRTMVLADRNHKKFPVSADYVGISLATTLQEHLSFSIGTNEYSLDLV